MKKSQSFFALLIVSLSYVLSPVTAKANYWDVPVAPGESFRWVFVTSGSTDATSPDISYYNDFVNDAADIVATPITGVQGKLTIADIEWKAIASTESVDAIDNIGYSLSPIFTPYSRLVAIGTPDLFDGALMIGIVDTECEWGLFGFPVWTGSETTGYGAFPYVLGHTLEGRIGTSGYTGAEWISGGFLDLNDFYGARLYAISEELSVIPAPGALVLAATGLLSMLGLKRWRRKH